MGGFGALSALPGIAQEPARPPNVVFFILDDMQRHMFNCLPEGKGKNLTPTIDRLAAEGTLMLGQHVASPVCTPSRYNCLTGRYASRALAGQAKAKGQTVVTWNTHIEPGGDNVAQRLRRAGYATGMVGKNHVFQVPGWKRLPYDADPSDPAVKAQLKANAAKIQAALEQGGFDYAASIYHNNPDGNGPRALAVHNLDWIAQGALEFIDRYHDRPFFLYFASTIPTDPGMRIRGSRLRESWTRPPMSCPRARPSGSGCARPASRRGEGRICSGWTMPWGR
jgi:arylsulfatase A-like enzyme